MEMIERRLSEVRKRNRAKMLEDAENEKRAAEKKAEIQMQEAKPEPKKAEADSVKVEAESDKFPKNWLFHYRWGKGKEGQKDAHGHSIKFETVGGRTSAVVTAIQGVAKKKVIKQKESDSRNGEGGDGDKGGNNSVVHESKIKKKKKGVDGTLAKKGVVSKAKKDIDGTILSEKIVSETIVSETISSSTGVPDVLPVAAMKKTKKRKFQ
jgi:formamidopyrimidine-DNA glycosylase